MATVTSYGAAETVTGSCHLLQLDDGTRVLIDCGMFQGKEEERNDAPFGFDPTSIEILLVTHAHLDHVGRIPKLFKEGFNGAIYATPATRDLAEVILLDSAKIMKEDYHTRYKKAQRRGEEKNEPAPLYDEKDVERLFKKRWHLVTYDKTYTIHPHLHVTFRNAGHILGSAFIEIDYKEKGVWQRVVFSGDIGNDTDMVMPKLQRCERADHLFIESTYGDRDHQSWEKSVLEFKRILIETLENWGNVIIPSFAVERTQQLLCILKDMHDRKELPECKIFLDSPMAQKATALYTKYAGELSEHCKEKKIRTGAMFHFDNLVYTHSVEESKKINEVHYRAVIIAGSGMCTGGRILHHFKNRLWNRKNALIFVGYQAEGTLGRDIVDGARWVKIYGEELLIRASVHTINGFSAHADQSAIVRWVSRTEGVRNIFLIHGERDKQTILRSVLRHRLDIPTHIVEPEEKIYLN
jgi:metallo-beta-lactamase family protein